MTWNLKEFVNHGPELATPLETDNKDHVVVLLGHYNGGAYLADQLRSLNAQTHEDWSLIVSDDGSTDHWLDVLAGFAGSVPERRIVLTNGPKQGFARNFLALVNRAGPSVPYAAFCDQDDVWLPHKLSRAVARLREVRPGRPALYCSRTTICDRMLKPCGMSPLFQTPPSFGNALVQNIGGGNTMVMNRAALDLLQDTARHAADIASHDWWAYQIVSGAGGQIIYDPEPSLLYRQHSGNLVGANQSRTARIARLKRMWRGDFRSWNDANTNALRHARHWLTPDALETLDAFEQLRNGSIRQRLCILRQTRIRRQTACGQVALVIAALLRRL
jgi:glycosyltransferase involved in cell wall biosynthesis